MASYKLECFLEGDIIPFPVVASSDISIGELKDIIKQKEQNNILLQGVDASRLILWKPTNDIPAMPSDSLVERIRDLGPDVSQFAVKLDPVNSVADVFGNQTSTPPFLDLIVGRLPVGRPTLVNLTSAMEPISSTGLLQEYPHLFVKLKEWGRFERDDLEGNNICNIDVNSVPTFVSNFERMLDRKPYISTPSMSSITDFGISEHYLEPPEDSTTEGGSQNLRYAKLGEVTHTINLASRNWERIWQPKGPFKHPLTAYAANSIFFDQFVLALSSGTAIAQEDKDWPFHVVVKREIRGEEPRKYCPHSDFLVSNASLPRLLVEVNSTPTAEYPTEFIRMLTTGAFIVRFANQFLKPFCLEKTFVLCTFFVWDNGHVARNTLFQMPNEHRVYYNTKELSWNDPPGRIEFARNVYNLLSLELGEEQAQDTENAIKDLDGMIENCQMESMHSKCTRTKSDSANRGSRGDYTQLRTHGYEVDPEVIVDASGVWEPLFKKPDHILTVYRPEDPSERFIAKKVREESKELEILTHLAAIEPRSDHVISLIASFDGWAILPRLVTLKGRSLIAREQLKSKIVQVCWGLVEGLAYLHEHCIAHRDIKPDNLLVDRDFCLKIIDFDIAMRVKNEDEEVDDQCGTASWMAPEVQNKLRHSPIKADRWACGRVLLYLLDEFKKDDEPLRAFARDLSAYDPKLRPSLLNWVSYMAPPLSTVKRKTVQARQDPSEVVEETTKLPKVKKQRLDGVNQNDDMCIQPQVSVTDSQCSGDESMTCV